jgi:hypothetical protein
MTAFNLNIGNTLDYTNCSCSVFYYLFVFDFFDLYGLYFNFNKRLNLHKNMEFDLLNPLHSS